jgi:Tol biopolymer transport system component
VAIEAGQQLAHYRIDRKIGEGGMGEVWAATDTRLNRPAAIKALPAALAADPERLGRFKREAQLLAALNHPNIAAIYGLEQIGDASYLALELIDGDDLSVRIEGRAVPYDEAVEIALQIAAALEEAHEKGIVHRDLKPANIKLAADGKVKVLDFGLAKALSDDPNSSASFELSTSPTLTAAMGTQAGIILGTAGYMAPEQARGKKVDRRADIWAFGVILFEMLTGERVYAGETVTDVIAAVVTREPDWDRLPGDAPVALRRVLRRCLQKDPRKRLRDIGDAALELRGEFEDEPAAAIASTTAPASSRRPWLIGVAGLALGLILATAVSTMMRPPAGAGPLTWSSLPAHADIEYDFGSLLELSPPAEGEEPLLWVRELGEEQARPLAGTEDAYQPFWSPDSQSIGYFAKRKLRRISIDGGVATVLADAGNQPRGGCWGDHGTILYGPDWSEPLFRVSDKGGPTEAVTQFNAERLELSHRWPHMLPDGKHFLFYAVSTYPELNPENPSEVDQSGLYIGSLDGAETRLLQAARSRAVYTDGSLLFVDDGILTARPFDLATLSFQGSPVSLVEGVTQSVDALWGGALFSVSDEGTLMFVRGAPERRSIAQLQWLDREGNELGTIGDAETYNSLQLSHEGNRLVTSIGDPGDIWVHDLERDTTTRFTFDPGNDTNPIWSPGDDRVLFQSSRLISGQRFTPSNLIQKAASGLGDEEHLSVVEYSPTLQPSDWSPDGKVVALTALRPETGADIVLYSFETGDVEVYLTTEYDEQTAVFSPDGRWLAYASDESGEFEIYVTTYPGAGGKWQVSRGGGELPVWRADGRELFYVGDDGLMSVAVETEKGFRHDTPVKLFKLPEILEIGSVQTYDVAADGRRFLLLAPREDDAAGKASVTLLQGWRGLVE